MSRCRGLTLVEVLVVLCVIFLLICLVLPALLDTNHDPSRRVACVINLRYQMLVMIQYANDHKDYFPGIDETGQVVEPNVLPRFNAIRSYLNDPGKFVCPADRARISSTDLKLELKQNNISYALWNLSRPDMIVRDFVSDEIINPDALPMITDRAMGERHAVYSTHQVFVGSDKDWEAGIAWMDGHASFGQPATIRTEYNDQDFLFDTHDASMVYRGKNLLIDPGHE